MSMKVHLANPRGFCAGVDRAIAIVDRALEMFGAPIYVRHEVVHNKHVVGELRAKGAIFVDEVEEVPDGSTLIFSAHGVSKAVQVEAGAAARQLQVFDATCPLVTKVHMEVARYARRGQEVVLIGHAGHPEVEGTMGQYIADPADKCAKIYLVETVKDVEKLEVHDATRLAYVSQTTLSVEETLDIIEALEQKFPEIQGPKNEDICYATTNRQEAVSTMATSCDLMLVVGSKNSSNSNRLRELAEQRGCIAYLIDDASDIESSWLQGVQHVGVTAGASAPEAFVQQVVQYLQSQGGELGDEYQGAEEAITFAMPKLLREEKVL